MRIRRMAAALAALWAMAGVLSVSRVEGAVARSESADPAASSLGGTRRVQGTVGQLVYRVSSGYPVTDVHLEPGGEVFTILGGMLDGVLWVAEEEVTFTPGDAVDLVLEPGAYGWRPQSGADGPASDPWEREIRPLSDSFVPTVTELQPPVVPAVADADVILEIRGRNFGPGRGQRAVLFQGLFEHVPAEVLSWSDERIRCVVPKPGLFNTPQVLTGAVKVWTPLGGWSDGLEWSGKQVVVPFQYAGDKYPDDTLPIRVYFNPAGFPWSEEVVREQIEQSLATWNAVEESYARFVLEGTTEGIGERRRDGQNVVSWTEPWPHASAWLAVTWSAFDPWTGGRIETDVEINSSVRWSVAEKPERDAYDLRSVLTHEFGHWLRLGHVQNPGSVMNAFFSRSAAVRQLAGGDRMGVVWIYPSYGTVSASTNRLVVGATDPVVLNVRLADRLGRPRTGLPKGEIYAELEWEGERRALPSERLQPAGPYFARRPTDAFGRTEILVPAPRTAGRARFSVVAEDTPLFHRPSVEFTVGPGPDVASGALRVLGPNPGNGSGVRAELRLTQDGGPFRARIFDARGRVVFEREIGRLAAGANEIHLDLAAAPAAATGIYFLEISGPATRQVAKFVRLR